MLGKYVSTILITISMLVGVDAYSKPETVEKIAKAYGIENFKNVRQISYTFNVEINGNEIHRRWTWYPKTDDVEFVDLQIKYPRDFIPVELKDTDHNFINDNYWLLFPFHLVWDKDIEFEETGEKQLSPVKNEKLNRLIVKYVNNKGYTPNDIYELYYDDDYIIKEWVYRKRGSYTNKRAATWESNNNHNGIIISENHLGKNNFRLWFTDIEIK
jgi:hypothetical protein